MVPYMYALVYILAGRLSNADRLTPNRVRVTEIGAERIDFRSLRSVRSAIRECKH